MLEDLDFIFEEIDHDWDEVCVKYFDFNSFMIQ